MYADNTPQYAAYMESAYPVEYQANLQNEVLNQAGFDAAVSRDVSLLLHRMCAGGTGTMCNHSLYCFYNRFYQCGPSSPDYHPQWFADYWNNSDHSVAADSQLVYNVTDSSNPDYQYGVQVAQQVAQDAADYYAGVETGSQLGQHANLPNEFNVMYTDSGRWCINDQNQLNPTTNYGYGSTNQDVISDYWFSFVNQVVADLHAMPGQANDRVVTLAYAMGSRPPLHTTISPSVDVQYCWGAAGPFDTACYNDTLSVIQQWANLGCLTGVWNYPPTSNLDPSVVNSFPAFLGETLGTQFNSVYNSKDRQTIFDCGWYTETDTYVESQLMLNSTRSADALLNDYFTQMYGPAAGPMESFYALVENTYSDPVCYPAVDAPGASGIPGADWHQFQTVSSLGGDPAQTYWGWLGNGDRMSQLQTYINQATTDAGTNNVYASRVSLFMQGVWNYMQDGRSAYLAAENPPLVTITSPTVGATFVDHTDITLTASTTAGGGTITHVTFYDGSQMLGAGVAGQNGVYTFCWKDAAAGTHNIWAEVDDSVGHATSSGFVSITVGPPTAPTQIAAQPTDQAADVGQTATFVVEADGTDLSYQWQKWNGSSWQDITTDGTREYYTTSPVAQGDDGTQYRVVVTNSLGSLASQAAVLHVNFGLEALWKFDETSGISASDSSGNGNTGTLVNWSDPGDPQPWTNGLLNGGVAFDGVNSEILVPSTAALEYSGGEMTITRLGLHQSRLGRRYHRIKAVEQ